MLLIYSLKPFLYRVPTQGLSDEGETRWNKVKRLELKGLDVLSPFLLTGALTTVIYSSTDLSGASFWGRSQCVEREREGTGKGRGEDPV